ncbi:lectin [Thraustotheca clavata]|uniref:Lectin n=1 Tax=Thraustotheca clavata TaxID=74557 RepID=A0A1V9ZIF1_9STRA|nr:lectin [Thraustotheca clavata]
MKRVLSLLLLTVAIAKATLLPSISFEKPFDQISADGVREISDDFTFGGHAQVNRHFVRLTTDRQSKRGYIWSKNTLGSTQLSRAEFTIILTFRISGQAERWYGDGIGLWITTEPRHVDGANHGFTDKFTGFGVVIDTFVNMEQRGGHKDVLFLTNDGTKSVDDLLHGEKKGCDAKGLRYHERNANFSPSLSMSRMKIQFINNRVTIQLDPTDSGVWSPACHSDVVDLTSNWYSQATIGITGSTGSLADTHDIIGLQVYDTVDDQDIAAEDAKIFEDRLPAQAIENLDDISQVNSAKVKRLQKQYNRMIEDFEHEFAALKEETSNTIAKLRKQEQEDSRRIAELEAWVNGRVNEKVDSKVKEIEANVDNKLDEKLSTASSSGWKMPFFLLLLGLAGAAAFTYKKYQELRKSHLL